MILLSFRLLCPFLLALTSPKSMASASPPLLLQRLPTRSLTLSLHAPSKFKLKLPPSPSPRLRQSRPFPPLLKRHWTATAITSAYVTGPASDPIVTEPDHKLDSTDDESSLTEKVQPPELISWSLLWSLLAKHKVRLVVCAFTLVGCTSCTLSMPIFSGNQHSVYCFMFSPRRVLICVEFYFGCREIF